MLTNSPQPLKASPASAISQTSVPVMSWQRTQELPKRAMPQWLGCNVANHVNNLDFSEWSLLGIEDLDAGGGEFPFFYGQRTEGAWKHKWTYPCSNVT